MIDEKNNEDKAINKADKKNIKHPEII